MIVTSGSLKEVEAKQKDLLEKRKSLLKNLEDVEKDAYQLGLKKRRSNIKRNDSQKEGENKVDESDFVQNKKRKFNDDDQSNRNMFSSGKKKNNTINY